MQKFASLYLQIFAKPTLMTNKHASFAHRMAKLIRFGLPGVSAPEYALHIALAKHRHWLYRMVELVSLSALDKA